MARAAIWADIAATLSGEIGQGFYPKGSKIPTEAELAARFGVNRHTVRHALAELAAKGLVVSRRGAGVFVASRPTDYAIGRRVRFNENVTAFGQTPSRELTRLETRPAAAHEAAALGLAALAAVHVVEGVSLADGQPLAMFRSVFPAARFPALLQALGAVPSITAALAAAGVTDYVRTSTRVTAKLAKPVQALRLRVPEGAPILRTEAINADAAGVPVEYGVTWFAGDRVTLTMAG
ncbi:phosphonate metabolism transcriptional regulator PhnF [Paragemmobacter straminiformis]|uniref:Phosphonate metabolism transcriptional regulator PhnF n=1 Tax=Paragemmobacter straminiformis TaxID=2045119 RepID=A0A842IBZ1_9RHOB|nr:phosphonate metabolism transcriptional regulator PhnF [Gemmobacter straminiformis]MBC2836867.1 phosphonate metabolism transcriptional regulator PhnF [Gemmobacter straminiformis]